jgi:hypothetical protein
MYTAYGIVTIISMIGRGGRAVHDQHVHSYRVMIPYAVYIQFDLLRMSIILLETCRGM